MHPLNHAPTELAEGVVLTLPQAQRHAQLSYDDADLATAEQLCRLILDAEPGYVDAMNLLASIAARSGRFEEAADLLSRLVLALPDNALLHCNYGNVLGVLGHFESAIASYDQTIALMPDYASAHYNRGIALHQLGRLADAVASYDRVVGLMPDSADAWCNRGVALKDLGQLEAAVASFDQAIAFRPDDAEIWSSRGIALQELKQLAASVASHDRAIALNPGHAKAWSNRGVALKQLKLADEALASFDQAIALQPDYAVALLNRGNAQRDLQQLDAAVASYQRAIAIQPELALAWSNLGNAQTELKQFEAALASCDHAIALKPDHADAWSNRGNAQKGLGQLEAALASYDRALALQPDHAEAGWNKALALLLGGDFENGWVLYESRWRVEAFTSPKRDFPQPLWLGAESLDGKTILLHSEQGLGDTLQFCRYARLVASLGAKVIMEVQPSLAPLLKAMAGVIGVVHKGDALPEFDCHCPLLSLPLACKTTLDSLPVAEKYLDADAGKLVHWKNRLGARDKCRVGIVWSGNAAHANDLFRSTQLADWVAHLPGDFEYVSLQTDVRDADRATLQEHPHIRHFGAELHDFSHTAALCELMDVVISVDTSVAHLSGALGKPTWVLLPYIPDFRWLLGRSDSPWYPAMRLYRQPGRGDWAAVFDRIAADLRNL